MKVTKKQLKEMIQKEAKRQLNERLYHPQEAYKHLDKAVDGLEMVDVDKVQKSDIEDWEDYIYNVLPKALDQVKEDYENRGPFIPSVD